MTAALATGRADLALVALGVADAGEYRALLQRNAEHLGPDYAEELAMSEGAIRAALDAEDDPPLRFGIRERGILVGRVDLVAVDPPSFGMGYWVDAAHVGRGIATAAVTALLEHARLALHAEHVYAGVTHGNLASERVLQKCGFARVASFERYDRFHRTIGPAPRT